MFFLFEVYAGSLTQNNFSRWDFLIFFWPDYVGMNASFCICDISVYSSRDLRIMLDNYFKLPFFGSAAEQTEGTPTTIVIVLFSNMLLIRVMEF